MKKKKKNFHCVRAGHKGQANFLECWKYADTTTRGRRGWTIRVAGKRASGTRLGRRQDRLSERGESWGVHSASVCALSLLLRRLCQRTGGTNNACNLCIECTSRLFLRQTPKGGKGCSDYFVTCRLFPVLHVCPVWSSCSHRPSVIIRTVTSEVSLETRLRGWPDGTVMM